MNASPDQRLALIAGRGALPAALVAALRQRPLICALDGFLPDGLAVDQTFRVERLIPFLRGLTDSGIASVIFAGSIQRPRLDPALFDPQTATLVPRLLGLMQAGDDTVLRGVIEIFEESGLSVIGVPDVAPSLIPGPDLICGNLSPRDHADAARAETIVAALGGVDVGQGAVVAQGLCLGIECLAGTDAMLDGVAALPADLRPDPALGAGLFYKAAKPGQDLRIDLPTLGVATVHRAAAAQLGGIAWAAGSVICLDLPAMTKAANDAGLFLWSRA